MKTIYKYQLSTDGLVYDTITTLVMPSEAKVLSIQMQRNIPYIWVLVDTENKLEKRQFYMFDTGQELPDENLKFIGTFQIENIMLVFHLFEKIN